MVAAEAPAGGGTVMSTVPGAVPKVGGVVAVICVLEPAGIVPAAAPQRATAVRPLAGETPVTAGSDEGADEDEPEGGDSDDEDEPEGGDSDDEDEPEGGDSDDEDEPEDDDG